MDITRKSSITFFIKSIFIGWGVCCLVYAFMLFSFFWGNHDWEYLRHGVELKSGFFEARYSQHLFTVLLFEGHFLPIMTSLSSLFCVMLLVLFIALYLQIPQKMIIYVMLMLFVGLNPHISVLFYYQHYVFACVSWSLVGLLGLLWFEGKIGLRRTCGLGLIYGLALGSYPPFFALIFCLFATRRLFDYVEKKRTLKEIMCVCGYFGLALILALSLQKVIHFWLIKIGYVSPDMYNLQIRGLADILKILPIELGMSIKQLFHQYAFIDSSYVIVTVLMVVGGVLAIIMKAKNKLLIACFILICFLASRFTFILATQTSGALFRIEYWGRLGLYILALSILFKQNDKIIRNFAYAILVCCLVIFSKADLEIQKVQALAFNAEGKYQQRIFERIVQHENFDIRKSYISFVFGLPNLRRHFYNEKNKISNEILDYGMIFGFDFVNKLFEYEGKSPIAVGMEIWEERFFRATRNELPGDLYNTRDDMYIQPISYWLYNEAKPYPDANAIYIDNRYIILVPDAKTFYQKREQFIQGIREKGH